MACPRPVGLSSPCWLVLALLACPRPVGLSSPCWLVLALLACPRPGVVALLGCRFISPRLISRSSNSLESMSLVDARHNCCQHKHLGRVGFHRLAPNIDDIHQLLRNKHTLYHNSTQRVVQFSRLIDSRRSYHIHRLRYRVRIYCAMRVIIRSRTHTKLERLRCRSKGTCLVRTKTILPRQHDRKAPTRSGCSAQA